MCKSCIFKLLILCIVIFNQGCGSNDSFTLESNDYILPKECLTIPISLYTLPNSRNVEFKRNFLAISNDKLNTLTIINFFDSSQKHFDFSKLGTTKSFETSWLIGNDTICLFDKGANKIYLVSNQYNYIDSFTTRLSESKSHDFIMPSVMISTGQPAVFYKNSFYLSGISLGEYFTKNYSNRYVITEANKNSINYYVDFPADYLKKDMGGIYYRTVYHTMMSDSLMLISFPASDEIAIFNLNSKSCVYRKLFPHVSKYIQPFDGKKESININQIEIAKHYFSQYSFKEIVYDKYRQLIYRFLSLPSKNKDYLEKEGFGRRSNYLLVYDKEFNFLGAHLLEDDISYGTFFVHSNGLYLLKRNKNENILQFVIYSVRDDYDKL